MHVVHKLQDSWTTVKEKDMWLQRCFRYVIINKPLKRIANQLVCR